MKNLFLTCAVVLGLALCLSSCRDNSVQPTVEKTFPLTFTFLNTKDSTVLGGFDIRLAAYYPKKDSSYYLFGGLNSPAVGTLFKREFKKDYIGYPGVETVMLFSAMKVWPDDWPNQEPLYQTLKWFYIEKRTVKDSADATMSFIWPQDTARADVHEIDPDTAAGDFDFSYGAHGHFEGLLKQIKQ